MNFKQQHSRSLDAQGGFTMMELLVVLSVSIIAFLGLLSLGKVLTSSSVSSERGAEASTIAKETIEDYRGMTVAEITTSLGSPTLPASVTLPNAAGRNGVIYNRTFNISEVNDDLFLYQVVMFWTDNGVAAGSDGGIHDHTISLEMLRGRLEVF